jgi:hypothetical protein
MTAASPQSVPFTGVEPRPAPVRVSGVEFDLLRACCTDLPGAERASRLAEILTHSIDWERLIELSEHHGVTPQVYRRLLAASVVPPDSMAALRLRYEANARQTLGLTRELLRILNHLESLGIPALPHKGPVLAEVLYGNVAMRQFSDLDVFIHGADLARVKAALLQLGYEPGFRLTERQERAYLASGYECTFDGPNGRNLVEMQWQVLPLFYSMDFEVGGFFDRAVPVSVGGSALRTLCPEDMLLSLCAHAAKHAWIQLSWLCDIVELARSQQIDWDAFQQQAKQLGIARIVGVSFLLAHKLLDAPLPPSVQGWIRSDRDVETLTAKILLIMAQGTEYSTESISYFRLMMQLRERRWDGVRFFWRLVLTPGVGEWSAIRLPGPLFPLYRVVRLFRLLGRL